jgi:hypothetical protein
VTIGLDDRSLLIAVQRLSSEIHDATLPMAVPGVVYARSSQSALLRTLTGYVVPRLASLGAPLLAVVGVSTGAGKSTVVNSLVGSVVSRSGVLRPTTRSPVLVHHRQDEHWFTGSRVLPGLARVTGPDGACPQDNAVRLTGSERLPPGLALLDSPDIDSVVRPNRDLARQLVADADLWLFVTTAARYADAVPWALLRSAGDRGASVAVILNRMPPQAMGEVRTHLASMLREQGLASAPIFTVAETSLSADGLLSEVEIARLRSWLSALARDAKARSIVVRRTLTGELRALPHQVLTLSYATCEQRAAAAALHQAVAAAYAAAFEQGMSDGSLVRGDVLARWQELVSSGELGGSGEDAATRPSPRLTSAFREGPPSTSELWDALAMGLTGLLTAQSRGASASVLRRWRQLPGGTDVLVARPEVAHPASESVAEIEGLVRDWQRDVLELVGAKGRGRRTSARLFSFGVNPAGVILMLLVVSPTGRAAGDEMVPGGSWVLGRRILEVIFGHQVVVDLVATARHVLLAGAADLYDGQQVPMHDAVASIEVRSEQTDRLSAASLALVRLR